MAERILAEFATEDAAAAAVRTLRERGHRRLEAYLPFPSHAIEDALARPRSRLPVGIFVVGAWAAAGAYALQWVLVAYLYPLVVGARPPHFPLTFVIITFEMGVLFAGLAAFVGTLILGRLVRLVDDVQDTPGFESATRDAFWIEVSMREDAYDPERTPQLLVELGAQRLEQPEPRR